MIADKLQWWTTISMPYPFKINHRTIDLGSADFLPNSPIDFDEELDNREVVYDNMLDYVFFDSSLIRKHATEDRMLRKIRSFVENGWSEKCEILSHLKSFFNSKYAFVTHTFYYYYLGCTLILSE